MGRYRERRPSRRSRLQINVGKDLRFFRLRDTGGAAFLEGWPVGPPLWLLIEGIDWPLPVWFELEVSRGKDGGGPGGSGGVCSR